MRTELQTVLNTVQQLARIVAESLDPGENVLDTLSRTLLWNFQASEPKTLTDNDPIHKVAFKLFSEHVAGADQLVNAFRQASDRMLRRPGIQRLGDTFQTVIAVPEPDMGVAAD